MPDAAPAQTWAEQFLASQEAMWAVCPRVRVPSTRFPGRNFEEHFRLEHGPGSSWDILLRWLGGQHGFFSVDGDAPPCLERVEVGWCLSYAGVVQTRVGHRWRFTDAHVRAPAGVAPQYSVRRTRCVWWNLPTDLAVLGEHAVERADYTLPGLDEITAPTKALNYIINAPACVPVFQTTEAR